MGASDLIRPFVQIETTKFIQRVCFEQETYLSIKLRSCSQIHLVDSRSIDLDNSANLNVALVLVAELEPKV